MPQHEEPLERENDMEMWDMIQKMQQHIFDLKRDIEEDEASEEPVEAEDEGRIGRGPNVVSSMARKRVTTWMNAPMGKRRKRSSVTNNNEVSRKQQHILGQPINIPCASKLLAASSLDVLSTS